MGDAVPCDADGQPADCTDCSDSANLMDPDCLLAVIPTAAPVVSEPPADGATTAGTGAGTGTDTTAAPAAGQKTRTKRKWKVVRKPGKTVIKRRRNGSSKAFRG
ncbi:uncharacterized protein LOC115563807 [Drosophila navojoa]|uniref:uncharacterized protein LOC115563807 n=1 Tax=Drosophila navojoa TaxID=7232 RepID=UPI0011BDF213|nr:uncharacterized protein LOC115563807 [Drosophila navojoa]